MESLHLLVLASPLLYQGDQTLELFLCPVEPAEMIRNPYSLLHNPFPLKSVWEGKKLASL